MAGASGFDINRSPAKPHVTRGTNGTRASAGPVSLANAEALRLAAEAAAAEAAASAASAAEISGLDDVEGAVDLYLPGQVTNKATPIGGAVDTLLWWTPATAVTTSTVRRAPDGSSIKSTANRTTRGSFDATEKSFWTVVGATPGTLEADANAAMIAQQAAPLPTQSNVGYDVVALLGQSNMAGGDPDTIDHTYLDPITPRIMQYATYGSYKGQIILGVDGLFHPFGQAPSVSPGVPAATALLPWLPDNRRILLVPTARGASGFTVNTRGDTWDPANTTALTNLYNLALANIDAALVAAGPNSRLVGVLWLQGENDAQASMSQATYAAYLDSLIDGLRSHFGLPNLPFILGQMVPSWIAGHSYAAPINAAHIDTPRRKLNTAFIYGSTLTPNPASSGIHYSSAGQRQMGPLWADALMRFAPANVLGTPPVAPSSVTITQTSASAVTLTWSRTPGRVTDYVIEYRYATSGSWSTLSHAASLDATAALTGISSGSPVQARVSTVNEAGTSTPSPVASITMVTAPPAPTGLTLGTATDKAQPLSWTPVAGATRYVVQYKRHADSTWITFTTPAYYATTVTGLTASTSYDYQVFAMNVAGTGSASATSTGSTTASPPAMNIDMLGTTAFLATSLRRVCSVYTGPAIQVRRSSDNAVQDIGFDSSGNLDTDSLQAFVGSGSGYLAKWYDQSGNSHHLAQTDTTLQPRIVNAGVIHTIGARPAPYFDGTKVLTYSGTGLYAAGAASLLMVLASTNTGVTIPFSETNAAGNARYIPLSYASSGPHETSLIKNDAGSFITVPESSTSVTVDGSVHQFSTVDTGSALSHYFDGTAKVNAVGYTRSGTLTMGLMSLGAWPQPGPLFGVTGYLPEIIITGTALTGTVRQGGEADQKAYYSTP